MITISLCMIVKNEEDILGRILSQISPVVDEIIIVDTGSTDQTKKIARRFTSLIFDYPWNMDFAAARNMACKKASMDYWMWLDADDFITPHWIDEMKKLKYSLDPTIDVVMMKYITGFDEGNRPVFSYYRERLFKNNGTFFWNGRVHEAITPSGKILYSPIEIEHRKTKPTDPDRNLKIYEQMKKEGEILEARHQFYYARELFYHAQYENAAKTFQEFLNNPEGWSENKIETCLQLSKCYEKMNAFTAGIDILYQSFSFANPRPKICCELGYRMLQNKMYHGAIYWYKQALTANPEEQTGAFIETDCQHFIPLIQLCVCYDRLGDRKKALFYHKKAQAIKPYDLAVQQNEVYFQKNNCC
ncbi:MAG: glycosyltransferase family 2 protein [Lachnospiraceae bacterium]|nr:glycosyltransferase family 2 protein [Lachnospiraceae bacterium]